MIKEELVQKVADFWVGMIQKSMSDGKSASQNTTFPTQEKIDEFREGVVKMLREKQPRSLFSYSFVGLNGYQEVSCCLSWQAQTSTLIDWVAGKITER